MPDQLRWRGVGSKDLLKANQDTTFEAGSITQYDDGSFDLTSGNGRSFFILLHHLITSYPEFKRYAQDIKQLGGDVVAVIEQSSPKWLKKAGRLLQNADLEENELFDEQSSHTVSVSTRDITRALKTMINELGSKNPYFIPCDID